jgi:hypothetical protein
MEEQMAINHKKYIQLWVKLPKQHQNPKKPISFFWPEYQ